MNQTSNTGQNNPPAPPPSSALSNQINLYFSIATIPPGIVLNILTILIFWTDTKMRKGAGTKTMWLLYISLCIYDILALLNSLLFTQFLPSLGIDLSTYSLAACKILNVWRKTALQCPSWLQVIITFDRLRSVVFPNRFRFMSKQNVILIVLAATTILISIANIEYIWFKLTYTTSNNTIIVSCTPPNKQIITIADVINVLLRFLLPFLLMLVMNIVLVRSIFVSKRKAKTSRSMRREINYTLTVIGLNLIFLVLNLPWTVWYILYQLSSYLPSLQTANANFIQSVFKSVAFSILYIDNLSVFILNFFFNRIFRHRTSYLISRLFFKSSSPNPLTSTASIKSANKF